MSSTTCPVFYPTIEEFKDFNKYIKYIESQGAHLQGICKIVPPVGWFQREYDISGDLGQSVIKTPIKQLVSGKCGAFTLTLMEKKDMKVKDFCAYCERNKYECQSWQDRERKFWRSMGLNNGNNDPLYGADVEGSLFNDDPACGWNVNKLDTPLKQLPAIPGVSSAMLYYGSWRAMFAFHTEDLDLYSINYVHTGAAKSWYAIPIDYKQRFENVAAGYFTTDQQLCSEYLRHKTHILSPYRLKEAGLHYTSAVQQAGEFIITFPGSYHAGFNHGFNIAEATNFVTETWIPVGYKAKICSCRPYCVNIDVKYLETLILRHSKRRSNNEGEVSLSSNGSEEVENTKRLLRCTCLRTEFSEFDRFPTSIKKTEKFSMIVSPNNSYLYSDAISDGSIMQCSECGCWFHPKCLYGSLLLTPSVIVCHMCNDINTRSYTGNDLSKGGKKEKKKRSKEKRLSNPANTAESSKDPPRFVTPGGCASRVNDGSDEDIPQLQSEIDEDSRKIAVGDEVLVLAGQTRGRVVDISDGHFRLHVKGKRKDNDIWIKVTNYSAYRIFAAKQKKDEKVISSKRKSCDPNEGNVERIGPKVRKEIIPNREENSSIDPVVDLDMGAENGTLWRVERLLSIIEASHYICSQNSSAQSSDFEDRSLNRSASSIHSDYPAYLRQCKILFFMFRSELQKEVKLLGSIDILKAQLLKFSEQFVGTSCRLFNHVCSSENKLPQNCEKNSSVSMRLDIFYDNFCKTLNVCLGSNNSIFKHVSSFCTCMIRLVKLEGVESSVLSLCTEFAKLIESCYDESF